MKKPLGTCLFVSLMILFSMTGRSSPPLAQESEGPFIQTFETVPLGKLPPGWIVEATNQRGPLAVWQVIKDPTAPSGIRVLSLTKPSGGAFNLCWTHQVAFLNGTIEVSFRAISGKIDQGGGIMWRVRDKDTYYVARFNPLEDNFRIYYVKKGVRRMIASASVKLDPGKWHVMKIVQGKDRFTCFLDGRKYLHGRDSHLREAGGVGVWTKADAATRFDDFKVHSEK